MTTVASPQLRWSSVRDCARKAVFEATGAPHRERTLKEERQLARGRAVGHEYVIAIASESRRTVHVCSGIDYVLPYPALRAADEDSADILAELQVQWELGTGHCDAYIRETDTVLEILSSQTATGDMIHSKLLQAAGYARALDASSICVAVVDPATLEDDRVILTSSSSKWDEIMGEVDERIRTVLDWRDNDRIPGRVCSKPSESWSHFCQYAGHCFEDWQPAFAEQLQSEEAQGLAIQLHQVKTQRRAVKADDARLEREQKEIQAALEQYVPGGDWQVGGYLVKRSERAGRRSFDFDRAENDGRFPDGLLDEFTKRGEPFSVWDVEKTGPVVTLPDSDDEVPF